MAHSPLNESKVIYLYFDATYVKCRIEGIVRDVALLTAIGVTEDGKRKVLGASVSLCEAETHWRNFLENLRERGMNTPRLIITDAHEGLKATRKAVFNGSAWQRCQFHLQKNAQACATKHEQLSVFAKEICLVFDAPDLPRAQKQLTRLVKQYEKSHPDYSAWLEKNLTKGLSVFAFEETHRKKLRTSNIMENTNRQLKSRIRVIGLFPNESSLLRFASALLNKISDDWESSTKSYMSFEKGVDSPA